MASVPRLTVSHDADIDFLYLDNPDGTHAALIAGPLTTEDHRRAALFAAAAQLLEQCQNVEVWFTHFRDELVADHYDAEAMDYILTELRAAIATAEERSW